MLKSKKNKMKKWATVSVLFLRLDKFIRDGTNFRSADDSGCGMFIRAGILDKTGVHGSSACWAGATSMFRDDMILKGKIDEIGGPSGLIVGMILGTKQAGDVSDDEFKVEHVGVFAGYMPNENNELIPMVYSFNTDINRGNLLPFNKNEWIYYGWHKRIGLDD